MESTTLSPPETLPERERYTYSDVQELPEGTLYQLIDGSLVMSPAPTPYHQIVHARLFLALGQHVSRQRLGQVMSAPVDVKLSETDVLQPDLVFVAEARADIIGEQSINGAPDLVVEVLSPSTAYHDVTTKKRLYEVHGVHEYWIVDPASETVEVYTSAGQEFTQHIRQVETGTATSALLEGFALDLDALFE